MKKKLTYLFLMVLAGFVMLGFNASAMGHSPYLTDAAIKEIKAGMRKQY